MLQGSTILVASGAYLGLLFWLAWLGDRRADQARSIINNPYIYTLSMAVFCTAWTFYGSVGRAAAGGVGFLPVYLGPTLMAALWWFLLRKMLRITKAYGITSIADFIASRYGKSALLGGLVTLIAVIGIMPYISLQLKAVSISVEVILTWPEVRLAGSTETVPFWRDLALYIALSLAAFSILFGTRHIDATEHHQGMVAAIAFESLVKLIAFLTVGAFVTYVMFDGLADVARKAEAAGFADLMTFAGTGLSHLDWFVLTCLSGLAILFLPRQFQVAVIENVNEDHLDTAIWLFPLYLLLINLFVLPVALAGLLRFAPGTDADFFVLMLPMSEGRPLIVLLAYVGGLSAATAMVIVATIALSTMLCNDLIMPVLLRLRFLRLNERAGLGGLLLAIRRGGILVILLLGYLYFKTVGGSYALVTMGLISFAAAAQFAPPLLIGLFWTSATRRGALTGLGAGFAVWLYTLLLPAFARSGWLDPSFVDAGPFGIDLLRPYALFGLDGLHPVSHATIWSIASNVIGLVGVSLIDRQGSFERIQASLFVEGDRLGGGGPHLWRGHATVADLRALLARYLGSERTERALSEYLRARGSPHAGEAQADADLISVAERLLAGAIGAASARVMISTVVKGDEFSPGEVMAILDEASQVIAYSHELEEKSRALERAHAELQRTHRRLTELDRLKDDFLSTVSHELRTPLTSIRSFSEILSDHGDLDPAERARFLAVVVKESERLTRLIDDLLDLSRIESGRMQWSPSACAPDQVIEEALAATASLFRDKGIAVEVDIAPHLEPVIADRDRLMQVVINLLSNAAKFAPPEHGRVRVGVRPADGGIGVDVEDNGPGVPPEEREMVFEKFHQVAGKPGARKTAGSGLGLAICRHIVERCGGRIWVEDAVPHGARFRFVLRTDGEARQAAE